MKIQFLLALFLIPAALAAPTLIDPFPLNNSYTGKGVVSFYINTTAGSDVRLLIIAEDAYINLEPWENYSMTCSNGRCSRNVSFSLAGSDTLEYFYFEANDSAGTSTFATESAPLRLRIDRTPPQVAFNAPRNGTFVSGIQNLNVNVSDSVSGVNSSLLSYSVGAGWVNFNGSASFDTAQFSNGQLISVMVNATDNARNFGVASVGAIVDNAAPAISSPRPNGTIVMGSADFNITVTDVLSGVDVSRVSIFFAGSSFALSCSGSFCNRTFETSQYSDGQYNATFYAYDNASNLAAVNASFSILNSVAPISLSPEGYAGNYPSITATLTNPQGIVTGVTLNITKGGNFTSQQMNCNSNFTLCSYQLPNWGEGAYSLSAVAQNILGQAIADAASLVVDVTQPGLTVTIPDILKASHLLNIEVHDANGDRFAVTLTVLGNTQNFDCVPQSTTLFCSITYNFASINDGRYNATVNATDLAGNSAAYTKEVLVDTDPPNLVYVNVEPLNPQSARGVSILAWFTDDASTVASVYAIIRNQSYAMTNNGNNWSMSFFTSLPGSYEVSLNATDSNDNSAVFSNVGYFFMGALTNCGDNACNLGENYCLCPSDCSAPSCSSGSISCSSGVPVCQKPLTCGDGVCLGRETCNLCPDDCGVCLDPAKVKANTTAAGQDIADASQGVAVFAVESAPIFVTAVAVIILIAIVVLVVVRKKKHTYI